MRKLLALIPALLIGFAGIASAQAPGEDTPAATPWADGVAADGEAYFGATCTACHEDAVALAAGIPSPEWAWTFLATHFAADETTRANVIVFLLSPAEETVVVPEGNADDGELAFARNCVECHVSSVRLARNVAGDTPEDRALRLWAFLAAHHAPDDTERADIIAFLLAD